MSLITSNGNNIETVAPIPVEKLKLYFEDKNTKFIISYKDSALKGSKLLIYLSNIDIPCDLDMSGCSNEEFASLMSEYLNSPFLVNLPALLNHVLNLLFYKNKILFTEETILDVYEEFISENAEILEKWESILDSCLMYNFYTLESQKMKEYVQSLPAAEPAEEDLRGINFVHLFDSKTFYYFYQREKKQPFKYYSKYFNEYIFKGKNLYHYWANERNPYFLVTMGFASGNLKGNALAEAKIETIKNLGEMFDVKVIDLDNPEPTTTP